MVSLLCGTRCDGLRTDCFGDVCFQWISVILHNGAASKSTARSIAVRPTLHIVVWRLDASAPVELSVCATSTVAELRQRLLEKLGVVPDRQRLVHGSTILDGYMTLSESGVVDGDHITLIVMPEEVEILTKDVGNFRDCTEDFDLPFGRIHRELWRFPEGLTTGGRVIYESVTREELPESITWRQPCELNMLPKGWIQQNFPVSLMTIEGLVLEVRARDALPPASVSVQLPGHPEQMVCLDTCTILRGFSSPALAHRVAY